MSNNNADRGVETSAQQAGSSPNEAARPETGEPDAFAVVEALNAENSQLKDRVLRTLAEMENLPPAHRARGVGRQDLRRDRLRS